MEGKTILVTVLLAVLGIAIAVAGFVAEATKPKLRVVDSALGPECRNQGSPAIGLAIAATVAILIARSIITGTTGGCSSCCQAIPNGHKFARVCIIISWITSTIAVILFIAAAKLSSRESMEAEMDGMLYCYTLRPGVFAAAGIMGLVGVLLGLIYYRLYASARRQAAEKTGVDLELEKPPVTDVKKPTISDGKKPQERTLQKH